MPIKQSKKITSRLISNGRAIFVYSDSDYKWDLLPNGSLLIDEENGKVKIKLEGKADWTPVEEVLNKDSNLIIHGNRIIKEPFLVIDIDKENDTITYINHRNERRHKFIYRYQKDWFAVFELDKGSYIQNKNLISATINNTIECNDKNYKLQELTSRRIGIDLDVLIPGCWVDVQYYDIYKMTQPGYNIFINKDMPEKQLFDKSMAVVLNDKKVVDTEENP